MSWAAILCLAGGCYAFKAVGAFAGRRAIPPLVQRILVLLPPALLGGLIAEGIFTDGDALVVDERVVGLGAASIAVHLRAPFALVVVVGGGVTALLRLLG